MATLADIFDKKLPDNAGEDSFSLLPLLKGSKKPVRDNGFACRYDGLQALRLGSWKLICTKEPQLYNLAIDIGETKNVASENQELVRNMMALRTKLVSDGRSTPGVIQQNDVEVNLSFAQ